MKKIFAVLVSLCLLGGCTQTAQPAAAVSSETQSSGASAASSSGTSTEGEREIVSGRVTAIDGNSVTFETMPEGGMRGARGERPDGEPVKGDRKDAPSSTESAEALPDPPAESESSPESGSSNSVPERPNDENRLEPRQMEEKTVTIPDGCAITIVKENHETDGTIEDIGIGSMIRVTLSEDGQTVRAVAISGGMPEGGLREGIPFNDKKMKNEPSLPAENKSSSAAAENSSSAAEESSAAVEESTAA